MPEDAQYGDYGRTLLHEAAAKGHTDIVKALLAGGANVDAVGKDGRNALHCAGRVMT